MRRLGNGRAGTAGRLRKPYRSDGGGRKLLIFLARKIGQDGASARRLASHPGRAVADGRVRWSACTWLPRNQWGCCRGDLPLTLAAGPDMDQDSWRPTAGAVSKRIQTAGIWD